MISANSHLICVVGGKGGVGKSIFSTNFSLTLLKEMRVPVLLIDGDTKSCGDLNILLGVKPNKTFAEAAQHQGMISAQNVNQIITPHPSGLAYVGAVKSPEETLNLNSELAVKFIQSMSQIYKYIIIDCGHDINPFCKALLQEATAITVVTTPEVLAVNQTKKLVNELLSLTFPLEMMQVVVNKTSPSGLTPQVISQTLKAPLLGQIPIDDVTSTNSIQKSSPFVLSSPQIPVSVAYVDISRKLTGGVLQKLKSLNRPSPASAQAAASGNTVVSSSSASVESKNLFKLKIHSELKTHDDLKRDLENMNLDESKEKAVRQKATQIITQIVDRESPGMQREDRSRVIKEVLDEALGLGPLEDLLADSSISEIMVNGYNKIFTEKGGRVSLSPYTFTSNDQLRNVIVRIVAPLGRQINISSPMVDGRLRDGSRVNAVIEPLAIDGPALTIRKFKKGGIDPEKYVEWGSMSAKMLAFLKVCVENRLNIIISGGTGSGKTSLLNMLSSHIPAHERVVTVEDAAELQLQQEHVVRLETRPSTNEGTGSVTIRDLVKNALRMRPDRIIVGETRDGAALDMLQAMNTGHDGSMTTTHSNNPRECVARLETLCLMSGMELPMKAIREQVASSVNIIVQISRLSDGSRKIKYITEVQGMQGDVVTLADIFKFKEEIDPVTKKVIGEFQPTGTIPRFIERFEQMGIKIPREIFSMDASSKPKLAGAGTAAPTPSAPAGSGGTTNNVNNIFGAGQIVKKAVGGKP